MKHALFFALALGATPAWAEDVALIVANDDYDNAWGLWSADDLLDAAEAYEAAGFRVFRGENLDAAALRDLAREFAGEADGSGRIVIALAGHFVQSGTGGWFLGTDTDMPDLISAGAEGLALAQLYEIAARAPGQAAVLLGTESRTIALDASLTSGTGTLPVPQGVAVLRGEADDIAEFAEALVGSGDSIAEVLSGHSAVRGEGFLTAGWPFAAEPAAAPPAAAPPATPRPPRDTRLGEETAWAAARAADTVAAYEKFLTDYPGAAAAPLARAAIEQLQDPVAMAKAEEDALSLTRDERREIQRNLTLLEFDTRGIDGILGPASRRALTGWQRENDAQPTGYLTRETIERIDAQAARRAEALEAEAAARQAEQERLDRAYWEETGAKGDEAGLRAYLKRYPDGLFAEVAQDRLQPFDDARETEAVAADRTAWERATALDDVPSYREYLAAQPDGAFREQAEARIEALTREAGNEDAARAEAALGLNASTRRLIESRLDALDLRPGRVDGTFDDDTRRAIRRYQTARNMPVTGYLTAQVVARLLADSLLRR